MERYEKKFPPDHDPEEDDEDEDEEPHPNRP